MIVIARCIDSESMVMVWYGFDGNDDDDELLGAVVVSMVMVVMVLFSCKSSPVIREP